VVNDDRLLTTSAAPVSMTPVPVRRSGGHVSADVPRLVGRGMTTSDQLARWARRTPDAVALRFEGSGRSYAELDERVTRLARALAGRGVNTGDRVAVLGLNGLEVWEAYLAGVRLGAVVVPVNFRLVADEVAYVLSDSGAVALVVDSALAEVAAKARGQAPGVRTVLTIGGDYEEALAAAGTEPLDVEVDEDAAAFIMYTSGTTGRPKGAVLTHRNLLMHVFSQVTHLGVDPSDRVAVPGAPLFHIAGLAGGLPPLLLGGTHVILRSGGFDPVATLDLIERERVTNIFLVPAMWAAVVAVPDIASRDLSSLRRISWGAAPASTTLLRTLIDTFPQAEVVTAFGQTECSPVTCFLRGEDSVRKIGSIGTPMLNVEVRVVDDAMQDVPQGEVGEIVYRSPMVMREYWGKPEATAEAFAGGWFHSGDLVRQDEDGYLYVVDRKKDMIITGGENVYCAEVEDVLAGHPKVGEVALIGVPDARYGEAPLAVVAPRDPADPPTPEELTAWCRERLARYKNPREYSIVGALPRNPSGKVLKTRLREEHSAGSLVAEPVI
jgi:fatty-acyl-CoA synthase/long-chain acyl-CoA synthetase